MESWNLHLALSLFSESQQARAFVEMNAVQAWGKYSKRCGAVSKQKVNINDGLEDGQETDCLERYWWNSVEVGSLRSNRTSQ